MFHGVMVALEFLVLSVIVRIGVEQLPLPEPCLLHPRFGRALIPRIVYMTLLFFCPCSPYSLSNFRFSWLHYFSASSQACIENQWVTSNQWAVLGGVLMKSGIRGYSFFLCNCIAVQPTIPMVFFRIVLVRFSFGSRSVLDRFSFILRSSSVHSPFGNRRLIEERTENHRRQDGDVSKL